jgi:hypothetical protein
MCKDTNKIQPTLLELAQEGKNTISSIFHIWKNIYSPTNQLIKYNSTRNQVASLSSNRTCTWTNLNHASKSSKSCSKYNKDL